MGYYTKYYLEIYESFEDMEKENYYKNKPVQDYDKIATTLEELINGRPLSEESDTEDIINRVILSDIMKWYNNEEDLIKLSTLFPKYFFLLHGFGEDSDDIWRAYAHNGKYVYAPAIITFPAPKASDLT